MPTNDPEDPRLEGLAAVAQKRYADAIEFLASTIKNGDTELLLGAPKRKEAGELTKFSSRLHISEMRWECPSQRLSKLQP